MFTNRSSSSSVFTIPVFSCSITVVVSALVPEDSEFTGIMVLACSWFSVLIFVVSEVSKKGG